MEALTNSELITLVIAEYSPSDLRALANEELMRRVKGAIPKEQQGAYHRIDSVFDISAIRAEHEEILKIVGKIKEAIGSHWSDLDMMSFAVDYRQSSGTNTVIDFFNQWKAKRNANH